MATRQPVAKFTYDDYRTTLADERYELLDGDLTSVPPRNLKHQRVEFRLSQALSQNSRPSSVPRHVDRWPRSPASHRELDATAVGTADLAAVLAYLPPAWLPRLAIHLQRAGVDAAAEPHANRVVMDGLATVRDGPHLGAIKADMESSTDKR